jgi:hypothetical protein
MSVLTFPVKLTRGQERMIALVVRSVREQHRIDHNEQQNLNADVVLVTEGAGGITAECALAFAKKTGAKLARRKHGSW